MSLRGAIADFPLETIVQLLSATGKTGQLELRAGDGDGGMLGFDAGRLVAAASGDDVGEHALGAVFAATSGDFEFVPWNDPPAANLSGDLDQLLDRAVQERDRIVADRKVIPDDRMRFTLSARAASHGDVTMSSDQWKALLAIDGRRDLRAISTQLELGRLATLALLAGLVRAGVIDTVEPAPEAPAEPERMPAPAEPERMAAPAEPAPASWQAPPPASPTWEAPAAPSPWEAPAASAPPSSPETPQPAPSWEAPAPERSWDGRATPAQSWESPSSIPQASAAPAAPSWDTSPAPPSWERPREHTPTLAERMAALGASEAEAPAAPVQPESAPEPERAAEPDERLSALSGIFGTPTPTVVEPPAPAAPVEPVSRAGVVPPFDATAPRKAPTIEERKKPGLFGGLFKRDEASAVPDAAEPGLAVVRNQSGQLAAFANMLLAEYNSGQYGKGHVDDRMTTLLMRVDEVADPIDRPLPVMDDRIDVQALERSGMPPQQVVPYLAQLVGQIHADAEKALGKDKAKKAYVAARQRVFGGDTRALAGPEVAGKLPKV